MTSNRTFAASLLLASGIVAAMSALSTSAQARVSATRTAVEASAGSSAAPEGTESAIRMREIVHVQVIPGLPIPILVIVPAPSSPPPSK